MGKKKAVRKRDSSVNKAQSIREYSDGHPECGPKAIAAALNSEHGWDISPQYVSTIKSSDRRRFGARGKRGRPLGSTKELSVDKLKLAKEFCDRLGGMHHAKAALVALEELIS